jgi:predicted transcriptional regulator
MVAKGESVPETSSVRIRQSLHSDLKVAAAELSELGGKVTMAGLLEEGIEGVLNTPLDSWVRWAKAGLDPVSVGDPSVSFRIRNDLSARLSVLAAHISRESHIDITKTHLLEVASRQVLAKARKEIGEMKALLKEIEHGG